MAAASAPPQGHFHDSSDEKAQDAADHMGDYDGLSDAARALGRPQRNAKSTLQQTRDGHPLQTLDSLGRGGTELMPRLQHGNFAIGRPQTNQNYHTQNAGTALPTFQREAMTESAMLSRKIPMTAKNAPGAGELPSSSAIDQLAGRPHHLPERTIGLRSSLDRTGGVVPNGPKMRLKSANAGARPHIFKK